MHRWNLIVEALAAGALGGSAVGLIELGWTSWAAGQLDGLAAAWAWTLYGAVGAVLGALVGAVLQIAIVRWSRAQHLSFGGGALAGFGALVLVVGPYLLNRELFDERGLAWWAWLVVVVVAALPIPLLLAGLRSQRVSPGGLRPALGLGAPWLIIAGLLWFGPVLRAPPVDPPDLDPGSAPQGSGVLLVVVDTLRADALEAPPAPLPAFDGLAADSVVFESAWSAAAWTRPAFATLLTSRLPSGHVTSTKASRLPEELIPLAAHLAAHQIPSAALINNVNVTARFGFDRGFTQFDYLAPDYPLGASEVVFALSLYKLLHRVFVRLEPDAPVERAYQPARVVLDRVVPWLRAHQGRSHLALVHLMEPHDPYFEHTPVPGGGVRSHSGFARAAHPDPDPSQAHILHARYHGEVAHLDRQLDAFFSALRRDGLYDELTIVLTSDHGEEFYEHGGWWHGDSLHAEQTRIPLWIKLPRSELAGARAEWTVRALDVAPTVAQLLKIEPAVGWEGADLLGPLERAALRGAPVAPVAAASLDPSMACRQARRHPLDRIVVQEEDFAGNVLSGVRTEGMALLRAEPGGTREWPERALFDVHSDFSESDDLLALGESRCRVQASDWASQLGALLDRARAASAADGAEPAMAGELDAEERRRLCALGYLHGEACP